MEVKTFLGLMLEESDRVTWPFTEVRSIYHEQVCAKCGGDYSTFSPRNRRLCDDCQWVKYGRRGVLDMIVDRNSRIRDTTQFTGKGGVYPQVLMWK